MQKTYKIHLRVKQSNAALSNPLDKRETDFKSFKQCALSHIPELVNSLAEK